MYDHAAFHSSDVSRGEICLHPVSKSYLDDSSVVPRNVLGKIVVHGHVSDNCSTAVLVRSAIALQSTCIVLAYTRLLDRGSFLIGRGTIALCPGMQGLNACRCQRSHVGPRSDHRTGSGDRPDRERLHCSHARGELGSCGHRHRLDRGGCGHVCHRPKRENGPRLGEDRPPSQGGENPGACDGERNSIP